MLLSTFAWAQQKPVKVACFIQWTLCAIVPSMDFRENLQIIISNHDLTLESQGEGFKVALRNVNGYNCFLSIGPDELEWYLFIANSEVEYTDWIDYHGYKEDSKSKLVKDKLNDINWFLTKWNSCTDLKLSEKKSFLSLSKKTIAHWKHGDSWRPIQMYIPNKEAY
jgi:hypothetical protein